MAKYQMTAPNGQTYEIEGPDGATDEQVRAEILRQFPEADASAEMPEAAPKLEVAPDRSLGQLAGVVTGALAPYATAAGLGAAAGAPLAGIGAIPGAAGGILSLGLSDLATGAYNLAAPAFGGERVPLPSETIRKGFESVGAARAPQTAEQRILSDAVQALAGGVATPAALGTTATRMAPSVTRSVMQTLAQAPREQAAASVGAGLAPSVAREVGVTNPLALTALSLAGGVAGGRAATPKPTAMTAEELTARAGNAYETARNAGVRFDDTAVSDLAKTIRNDLTTVDDIQFNPRLHPRIAVALDEVDAVAASGQPVSFSQLEMMRRVANTARRSADPDERRLGSIIIDKIDNFVSAPPSNAVIAGDAPEAAMAITEARRSWRLKRQGEAIDDLVERAANSANGISSQSLRSQFRTVVNNPKRLSQFDPEVQKLMKDFVKGKGGVGTLQALGNLAPGTSLRGILAGVVPVVGAATGAVNPVAALMLAAGGAGSKAAANRMATSRVENIASAARGGAPKRQVPMPQVAAATGVQALLAESAQIDAIRANLYDTDPNYRAIAGTAQDPYARRQGEIQSQLQSQR